MKIYEVTSQPKKKISVLHVVCQTLLFVVCLLRYLITEENKYH